jgi:16S rRNA (guanine(1405)-N(7))-methyltransferase
MSKREDSELEALITHITQSKKYRDIGLCEDTIRDLLVTELKQHKKRADGIKAARAKLHQIVAPYLGDPDYDRALAMLEKIFTLPQPDEAAIKGGCAQILATHATTKERLLILDKFYPQIFEITGKPRVILDLACGLNPLSFPWMGLPRSTHYYAYDIHQKRIEFLNQFFSLMGLPPLARLQDILIHYPVEKADVAFIFKEVHRFERRRHGCTLPLLDALQVRHLVISFPTESLKGQRALTAQYRQLFKNMIQDRLWQVVDIEFENELVFCVDKLS